MLIFVVLYLIKECRKIDFCVLLLFICLHFCPYFIIGDSSNFHSFLRLRFIQMSWYLYWWVFPSIQELDGGRALFGAVLVITIIVLFDAIMMLSRIFYLTYMERNCLSHLIMVVNQPTLRVHQVSKINHLCHH